MRFENVSGNSSIETALLEVLPAFLQLIDEGGSDVELDISVRRHIKSAKLRAASCVVIAKYVIGNAYVQYD